MGIRKAMTAYLSRPALILVLALGLTVVPTIGSRGMGTLGERFSHADRPLLDTPGFRGRSISLLQEADAVVEQQVLETLGNG